MVLVLIEILILIKKKMTTEAAIKDKACLEQQIEDLQVLIRNVINIYQNIKLKKIFLKSFLVD